MKEYLLLALENPNFWMTIILVWLLVLFFIPLIWILLKWQKTQNEKIVLEMKKGFNNIALSQKDIANIILKKVA